MKMRVKNGELSVTDKQNIEVFEEHLSKVYNNKRKRFADAAKFLKQREEFTDLDSPITMKEFVRAIGKLKNNKAPGITEIPAKAFKCFVGKNRKQVYFFIVDCWEGKSDYWEWHTGLGVMVPKKGDLRDPNKWQGISLTGACSKQILVYT